MKNKSTLIVSLFSVLVILVLGTVIFQVYKHQVDNLVDTSMIKTQEEENQLLNTSSRIIDSINEEKKPLIIKGNKVAVADAKEIENVLKDIKQSSPKVNIPNSTENNPKSSPVNNFIPPKVENEFTYYAPEPTPIVNNPVVNNPVVKEPEKPIVEEPTPYQPPKEKTRLQSYIEAMNRLKSRGSEIIVPISRNNVFALNFSADSDLNNILSYEYEVNGSKKGYGTYGSKTHLDTLKCVRYLSACKTILKRYSSGRYYVILGNVELYLR
jgi:hypothetical protein